MSTSKSYSTFLGIASFFLLAASGSAQTNSALLPNPKIPFLNTNGTPLSGGLVSFYAAGTTTYQTTYSDSGLTTPNTNPVILDSAGRASIYLGPHAYKVVVTTSTGGAVYTQDNVFDVGQLLQANLLNPAQGAGLVAYQPPNSGSPTFLSNLANGLYMGSMLGYQLLGSGPDTVAAGSVSRTLGQKLAEWVSLADFGAKCDGSTDDHIAIAAAMTYAQATAAHTIWVPPTGHMCLTSTSIDVGTAGQGIIFRGQSAGNSGIQAMAGGTYSTYLDLKSAVNETYLLSIGGGSCTAAVPYIEVRDMELAGAGYVNTVAVSNCGEENAGFRNMLIGGGTYAQVYYGYNAINSHGDDLTIYPLPNSYGLINLGITRMNFTNITINGGGTTVSGILQLGNASIADVHCESVNICVDSVSNTVITNIDCSPGTVIHTACVTIELGSSTNINLLTTNGVGGPLIQDYHRAGSPTPVLEGFGVGWYFSNGTLLQTTDPTIPWIFPAAFGNIPGGIGFAGPLNVDGHELLGDWGNGAYLQVTAGSPQGLIIQSTAIPAAGRTGGLNLNGVGYSGDPTFGSVMAGATYDGGTATPMGTATAASGFICAGGSCSYVADTGLTGQYHPTIIETIATTGVTIPGLHATTGTRYVCVDTNGKLVSSATACSGT